MVHDFVDENLAACGQNHSGRCDDQDQCSANERHINLKNPAQLLDEEDRQLLRQRAFFSREITSYTKSLRTEKRKLNQLKTNRLLDRNAPACETSKLVSCAAEHRTKTQLSRECRANGFIQTTMAVSWQKNNI